LPIFHQVSALVRTESENQGIGVSNWGVGSPGVKRVEMHFHTLDKARRWIFGDAQKQRSLQVHHKSLKRERGRRYLNFPRRKLPAALRRGPIGCMQWTREHGDPMFDDWIALQRKNITIFQPPTGDELF
jgi:hypothetical protein